MNKILVNGVVGRDIKSDDFIARLNSFNGDVTIYVKSAGGSFYQGIEMYNAIRNYTAGKVTAIIDSLAASISSYFIMACDEIYAYDNSTLMIHDALVVNFEGNSTKLRKVAETLDGVTSLMIKAYVAKTGKSEEDIISLLSNESYFFGDEMLSHGFVDKILATEMDIAAVDAKSDAEAIVIKCKGECKGEYDNEVQMISALLKTDEKQKELFNEAQKILSEVNYEN